MDILAALEAAPQPTDRKCKLATFLDSIPEDTPGRDQLFARVIDAKNFPAQQLTLTFTALGHSISSDIICDHRATRCRCYR